MKEEVFHSNFPTIVNSIELNELFDKIVQHFLSRGYTQRMLTEYIRIIGHFIYWVENEHYFFPMTEEVIMSRFYTEHLPICQCPVSTGCRSRYPSALRHIIDVLRRDGMVVLTSVKLEKPIDRIIADYENHLITVCGTTCSTCRHYTRHVRFFLEEIYTDGSFDITRLQVRDIVGFFSRNIANYTPVTLQSIATSIRSFLRYTVFKGLCNACLVDAVPSIAHWRCSSLPKSLSVQQRKSFLSAFDQSTSIGRRDYTIALCLIGLGMRSCEVADLDLDHIDWRKGTLSIHSSKGRRTHQLPLSQEIGQSIADYIIHDRPSSEVRNIFVQHRAPLGARLTSGAIGAIIRKTFKRCGITMPFSGSHVLRHTAATDMIRSGARIKEVADILGHRNINTTCIYTKVDLPTLSSVALPWPGEVK